MQNEDLIREKREKFRVDIRRKENENLFRSKRMTNMLIGLPISQRAQMFVDHTKNQNEALIMLSKELSPSTQEECLELIQNEKFKVAVVDILNNKYTDPSLKCSIINCLIDITYYELDSIQQFILKFNLLDIELILLNDAILDENKIEILYLIFNTIRHLQNFEQNLDFKKVEISLIKHLQKQYKLENLLKMLLMNILLIVDEINETETIFDLISMLVLSNSSNNNKVIAIKIINKLISQKLDPQSEIIIKYYDKFQEIFIRLSNDSVLLTSLIRYFTDVSTQHIQQKAHISDNVFIRIADIFILNDNIEIICDILTFFGNMILVNERIPQIIFQNQFFLQKIKNLLTYQDQCFFELWNLCCLLIHENGQVIIELFEFNGILEVLIDKFIHMTETQKINQFLEALLQVKVKSIIIKYPNLIKLLEFHSINQNEDTAEMSILIINQFSQ